MIHHADPILHPMNLRACCAGALDNNPFQSRSTPIIGHGFPHPTLFGAASSGQELCGPDP